MPRFPNSGAEEGGREISEISAGEREARGGGRDFQKFQQGRCVHRGRGRQPDRRIIKDPTVVGQDRRIIKDPCDIHLRNASIQEEGEN